MAAFALAVAPGAAFGQARGDFVVPEGRGDGAAEFAYWDFFEGQSSGSNYEYENPPALLGGTDTEGNSTTLAVEQASFVQTGTPTAFVTSSGAIYSFSEPTAFEFRYSGGAEVAGVVTQVISGGSVLELDDIRLIATPAGGGDAIVLNPLYKALDEPGSGGFAERVLTGFEWDLSGLGISSFRVEFEAPGSSMAVWEAQLDVFPGAEFVQALGYVLEKLTLPVLRWGAAGEIVEDLSFDAEVRFFQEGAEVPLLAEAESGFWHAGWVDADGVVSAGDSTSVTFGTMDESVAAVFAPVDYDAWREHFFYHANSLTGQEADHLDDAVSGRDADPEGDGLDNWAEFVFGCDPYARDADRATPVPHLWEEEGIAYPALTYRRWAVPEIEAGVAYRIVSFADGSWDAVDGVVELGTELQPDGTELVTVRTLSPLAGEPRILAVEAVEVDL